MFFLIGPGRSGSTLIRKHLCKASNCFIPHEVYFIEQLLKLQRSNQLSWDEYVSAALSIIEQSQDSHYFAINLDEFGRLLSSRSPDDSYFSTFLTEFFYSEARAVDSSTEWCVGDKSPINTFNACDIHKYLKKPKFIYILRFPIDVASSYVASFGISFNEALKRIFASYKCFWALSRRTEFKVIVYEKFLLDSVSCIDKTIAYLGATPSDLNIDSDSASSRKLQYISAYVNNYDHLANVNNKLSTDSVGKGLLTLEVDMLCKTSSLVAEFNKILAYSRSHSMFLH